ncbi:MAG: response regulator transcription factor [Pseudomonadota bacterium]
MRVLIADSQPLFRQAFAGLLQQQTQAFQAEFVDGHAALIQHLQAGDLPSLLVYDLSLPEANGLAGLVQINALYPDLPLLVIADKDDATTGHHARLHGAVSFMTRTSKGGDFLAAMNQLLGGACRLPGGLPAASVPCEAERHAELARNMAGLSTRRFRVLMGLREGLLNKQIAWDVGLSESSVKTHVSAIMRLLSVTNRTQVVIIATELQAYPVFMAREAAVLAERRYAKAS